MQAARYVLRFIPGIVFSTATYGSGNYGTQTYGQKATDPINSFRYYVVPLPAGFPTQPSWVVRDGDIKPPMRMQILTADANTTALDLTPVQDAYIVLTPVDGTPEIPPVLLSATIENIPKGIVRHNWTAADPPLTANVYRVVLIMRMLSGRRFSLPTDDALRLRVEEVPAYA